MVVGWGGARRNRDRHAGPIHSTRPKAVIKPNLSIPFTITLSQIEFLIDFAQILPGDTTANLRSRIVMTPLSAKLLMRALTENLARYEATFGEIRVPGNSSLAENLFRPYHPPEPPPEPPKE